MKSMEKFKRVYIEISNICNLQCSFCPVVERDKKIMDVELFQSILTQVSPFTNEVCLHLMGEPLAHPDFLKILTIAEENFEKTKVQINLTTNGILLNKYKDELIKSKAIRQINFSIQSFQDNFKDRDITPYLMDILHFSRESQNLRDDLYINFRLWNIKESQTQNESNLPLINTITKFFGVEINPSIDVGSIKSKKIINKIYFHFDSRFTWPSMQLPIINQSGFCHGLSGHIGIHADGTVVPCCLDKEAVIDLGNLKNDQILNVLNGPRAKAIKEGFSQKKLVEEMCKRCPYIKRFQ
jgi:radical SAM protein with 4Fe4S-binding SPASM domain